MVTKCLSFGLEDSVGLSPTVATSKIHSANAFSQSLVSSSKSSPFWCQKMGDSILRSVLFLAKHQPGVYSTVTPLQRHIPFVHLHVLNNMHLF